MNCPKCGFDISDASVSCPECGNKFGGSSPNVVKEAQYLQAEQHTMQNQQQIDLQREQLRIQQQQLNLQMQQERSKMVCPKCRNNNVIVQAVAEQKKRGCLTSILWIILVCCTCGLIILIPMLTRKGSKTRTYAVCQSCGYRWKV